MKVLLVVIDAASPRVFCPAVQTGRLPVFQALADAGGMHQASISIFPSITPAATSSIITGAYPDEHGIAGASWFEERRGEIAYYGDDFWVIAREGFGPFLRDFLVRLNGDRLRAPTLFELVERAGLRAACLNYLVFRGTTRHEARVPRALRLLPGVPRTQAVCGPSTLHLGSFVSSRTPRGRTLKGKPSLLHRFGMDDESTGALLAELMQQPSDMPALTVAYFADNDFRSHEVGPYAALGTLERVDAMLGCAFDGAGGLERVLEDTLVIVTSDHGHCDILDSTARAVVGLEALFEEFRCATLGAPWRSGDEIMVCPNMRAAQVYVREPSPAQVQRVVNALLLDPRVDQVMWRVDRAIGHGGEFRVDTHRGTLRFWRGGGGRDRFGGEWSWHGDPEALGLAGGLETDSADYPNPFERIAAALEAQNSGEVWVTARPGCEFEVPGGQAHVGGGSHGALHALDSLSPVVAAGGPNRVSLPAALRSVDLAPLCLQTLGLPMRYRVGEPRQGRAAGARSDPAAGSRLTARGRAT